MSEFYDVEQNTDAWFDLRAGLLTSSNLATVMANDGKAFGPPAKRLAIDIAIEQITGRRKSGASYSNAHMDRGHIEEPIARQLYEESAFCTVTNGGIYIDGFMGGSPDGRVGTTGLIEIKSAIPGIHFERVRKGGIDATYKWQCAGNMKIAGAEWIDFICYCADYPDPDSRLYVYRACAVEYASEYATIDRRVLEFKTLVEQTKTEILGATYWHANRTAQI